jgi:hypothetical protein
VARVNALLRLDNTALFSYISANSALIVKTVTDKTFSDRGLSLLMLQQRCLTDLSPDSMSVGLDP